MKGGGGGGSDHVPNRCLSPRRLSDKEAAITSESAEHFTARWHLNASTTLWRRRRRTTIQAETLKNVHFVSVLSLLFSFLFFISCVEQTHRSLSVTELHDDIKLHLADAFIHFMLHSSAVDTATGSKSGLCVLLKDT